MKRLKKKILLKKHKAKKVAKDTRKRKVCFVITSHIHYARSKLVLSAIKSRPELELQIVIGGSAIVEPFGNVEPLLNADGHSVAARMLMTLGGGTNIAMAKTAGLAAIEFTTILENLKPDLVVVRGDRYEMLPIAMVAVYMNIPVAHIEGGDLTGAIDDSVRHAITKLAHFHLVSTAETRRRVIQLGEHPDYVFEVGAPEIEFVEQNSFDVSSDFINYLGVGDIVNIKKPFLMVMQHPVTTEYESARTQIDKTLEAIGQVGLPTIWFWPNVDAGTDDISKGIRAFREKHNPTHIRFLKYLPAEQFVGLLKKAACLIGNSSAGIKEASFLGLPVVNIGTRQTGRYRARNVCDVDHDSQAIIQAIQKQLAKRRYEPDHYFYKPNTSGLIAEILATSPLYHQKKFYDQITS
ncbi:MAG: UDP-N-acetylglucosamine 2-epimerase [Patescibacteria group bacterium]